MFFKVRRYKLKIIRLTIQNVLNSWGSTVGVGCCKLFPQVVEPIIIARQREEPFSLSLGEEALSEVELAISDEREVVTSAKDFCSNVVIKLVKDVTKKACWSES